MGGPLSARALSRIESYEDARARARAILPKALFGYVDNGAEDELTLARNVAAFRELCFRPRMGVENPRPDLRTSLFGSELAFPVLTAPCGAMRLVHPEGDLGVALAAGRAGTIYVASSVSGFSLEEIAAVAGPRWFQLYRFRNRDYMESLVVRAQEAGYGALVVTVDTTVGGNREKDRKNGYANDVFRVNLRNALRMGPQVARRPGWFYRYWRDGMPSIVANSLAFTAAHGPIGLTAMTSPSEESMSPSFDDIVRIRAMWKGPLLVKGILTAEDALRSAALGADGVIVSNHGGRQLDGAPATVEVLPDIVAAVGGSMEVLLDSGVRRGTDVVKALALGAKAVLVGRCAVYGLAVGGQAGVERMLSILRADLERTMRLMGCRSVADLDPTWIHSPAGPRLAASSDFGTGPVSGRP